MAGLSRELIKWLQSLDLTWQVKVPKWDLSNGYLVAEIFSWYYPKDIEMHNYNTGKSLQSKQLNWYKVKLFMKKEDIDIPEEFIEGTIHTKEGAAVLLIERIYELLTNREVKKMPKFEIDFTDSAYQAQLPAHARATAAMSLKTNLRSTELDSDKSLILAQQKAQAIIGNHIEHRRQERIEDPARFNLQPTLGEQCARRPPPPPSNPTMTSLMDAGEQQQHVPSPPPPAQPQDDRSSRSSHVATPVRVPSGVVQFREVQVKQAAIPQATY